MRTPAELAAEINATVKRLQALQAELVDVRRIERDTIVRLFVEGRSPGKIALDLRMTRGAVSGVLRREGQSVNGRRDITQKLDGGLREALRHRAETMPAGGAR